MYTKGASSVPTEVQLSEIWWVGAGTYLFVRFKHNATLSGNEGDLLVVPNAALRGLGNGQAIVSARPPPDIASSCWWHNNPGSGFDNPKDGPKNGTPQCSVEIAAVLLG